MDLATIIVWILRTLLPIAVFWMYWKFQNSKADAEESPRESPKQKFSRATLLAHRKVTRGLPTHTALPHMVDAATAPALFRCRDRQVRTEPSAKKEKHPSSPELISPLVNYMAINRNEQQHTFFSAMDSAKANTEARKILVGAAHLKRVGVAMDLYNQLKANSVQIEEKTFSRMIEASIRMSDLQDAGMLLMEMEAAGFRPADALIDKVMALYEKQYVPVIDTTKVRLSSEALPFVPALSPSARSRSASPELAGPMLPKARSTSPGQRTALNPTARPFSMFVPKSSDQAQQRTSNLVSPEVQHRTALSTMAAPFTPSLSSKRQRTALSAMALPFSAIA